MDGSALWASSTSVRPGRAFGSRTTTQTVSKVCCVTRSRRRMRRLRLAPRSTWRILRGRTAWCFCRAFVDVGWSFRQTIIWAKDAFVLGRSDYHYRHEPIVYGYKPGPGRLGRGGQGWFGGNNQSSLLEVPRPRSSRDHPTMKPPELVAVCLRNSSRRGEIVLDAFGGSGSTVIACEQLGRKARLIEIDPGYCDVVVSRWERLTGSRAVRRGVS